ncbi:UNVERIFIED_CONTAM: protein RAE1 [Sesamum radiatum]|uniref:Protein RAE1 n=1 Tax=Sesamum radiatum TaxID=300843 RepID=A0AAW2S689_SESRA
MSAFGATSTNLNPNRSTEVLQPPTDSVSSLSFSPKANFLVGTSWDNQVRCWEVTRSGTTIGTVPKASISHDQPVLCSTWKDDGTTVFSGGCDKQVKMWPLLSGGQPVTVAMHDAPVKELAWIPEMNLLVTGSLDKTLRYWDLRQQNPTWVQQLPERCYALTVRHPLMVVGTADRNLVVFNLQNPQAEFKRVVSPLKYQTRCLAAFPDQQGFLVGSIEGRVGVHHLDDSQSSKNFTFKCHRDGNDIYSVNSLNFHPIHHTFATAGSDGAFNFWIDRGLRLCRDAISQYLAALSTTMVPFLHMRCVMIGARVLKTIIHQQQRLIYTCICLRMQRSKPNHVLQRAVESEVLHPI